MAIVGAVLLVVVLCAAILAAVYLRKDEPEVHADIEENFKYGSIGAEAGAGIPYWIWRVLPTVFPEHLPSGPGEGYERMGFLYESEDRPRPIGTSLRRKPIPLVGLNCAACHTTTVRDSEQAARRIVLGAPAQQFDIQKYFEFLFDCARDSRFTADVLLPAIEEIDPDFGMLDRLFYRHIVIPRTRDALIERADELTLLEERPDFGPGRVDTFFAYKLHFGITEDADDPVGTVDLPTLWNQAPRQGMWLHWDGNNNSVEERNLSAALGAGNMEPSVDHDNLRRITEWISGLPAPRMPRERIDQSRVPAGRTVYEQSCASCHDFGGDRVGDVTPIAEIGTDPNRWQSFTEELARNLNTFGAGYSWEFSNFRKSGGYANMPLDGIWLRAPYLHNGSIPTLRDLLDAPDERPDVFYRGYGVYDYERVGFVSEGPGARRHGFRYDTDVRGNGNEGHAYGTELSDEEKAALLEFLKTK